MIWRLIFAFILLFVYSCNDDPSDIKGKLSGSERIKQNLLPAEVNGESEEVGIFTIKRNEEGLNDETVNCDYYLKILMKQHMDYLIP